MTGSLPPYRLPRGGRNEAAGVVMGAAGAVVATIGLAVWAATQYVASSSTSIRGSERPSSRSIRPARCGSGRRPLSWLCSV